MLPRFFCSASCSCCNRKPVNKTCFAALFRTCLYLKRAATMQRALLVAMVAIATSASLITAQCPITAADAAKFDYSPIKANCSTYGMPL